MALSGSAGTACIAGLLRSFCCAPSAACPPSGRIIQRSLGSASCHRQQARDAPGRGEAPCKLTRLLMRAGSSRTSRLGVGAAGKEGRAARTAPRAARCCGGFVVLLGRVSVRSGGFHSSRTAPWGSQPGQTLRSGVMGSVCPLPARAAGGTEHPRSTPAPSRLLPGSRAASSALLSFKGGEESGRRPCQTKAPAVAGGARRCGGRWPRLLC